MRGSAGGLTFWLEITDFRILRSEILKKKIVKKKGSFSEVKFQAEKYEGTYR